MKNSPKKWIVFLTFLMLLLPSSIWGQTDEITSKILNIPSYGTYYDFKDIQHRSAVIYAGHSAITTNDAIQLNAKSPTGIISTYSVNRLNSVQVEWSTETITQCELQIFGSNKPYTSTTKLYPAKGTGDAPICTIKRGDQDIHSINGDYKYIGIRAEGGTVYLKNIKLNWEKGKQPFNFENNFYETTLDGTFVSPKISQHEGTITYKSSDTGVATVDAMTGEVCIKGSGTTTISASATETDKYAPTSAEYTLFVNSGQSKTVKFDFAQPQTLDAFYTEGSTIAQNHYFRSQDISIKIDGKTPSKFIMNKDKGTIQLKVDGGSTISIKAPEGFIIQDKGTGLSITGKPEVVSKSITRNTATYKVAEGHNISIYNLQVAYDGTYKLRIGKTGYATFSSSQPYRLSEGLKGGIVTVNTEALTAKADFLLNPQDIVAAQQGILLKGQPGEYTLRPTTENGKAFNDTQNALRPALTDNPITAASGKELFIFSLKNSLLGFYWQKESNEGNTVKNIANKAYLELPVPTGSKTSGFILDLGESTGIAPVLRPGAAHDRIFTPQGTAIHHPVNQLPRGIYIVNGKKIIIR